MATIKCKLYFITRISGFGEKVRLDLDKRTASSTDARGPKHILLGLYKKGEMTYEFLHEGGWTTPISIDVTTRAGRKPSISAMRRAAQKELKKRFKSMSLELTPSTRSYWTGTYWFKPTGSQFAAGFRVRNSKRKPIRDFLSVQSTSGDDATLELDCIAHVQGL